MNKKSSRYRRLMEIRSKNSLSKFGFDYRKEGKITTLQGSMDFKTFIKNHYVLTGACKLTSKGRRDE